MMLRSRRSSEVPVVDTVKPPSRIPTAVSKRRALGDITNAHATEESKEKVAKIHKAQQIAPQQQIFLIEQVPHIQIEDPYLTRDYMQRDPDDVDSRDLWNPLLASCYVMEMYINFKNLEKEYAVEPNFMNNQPYVNKNMRCILIDWLVDVHLKFKMVPETLYLTVALIDRWLEKKQTRRSKLQLVGVAALLLSAKYEEIYPPEIVDLVYVTDRAYDKKEILEMETEIAIALDYQLTIPTIHSFLCRYLKAAHADRAMVQLACFLAERTLQEYSMIKYLPSLVASTAVYIARKTLKRFPWSATLVKYTQYDESDMVECAKSMSTFVSSEQARQNAVRRKYSSPRFGTVALLEMDI